MTRLHRLEHEFVQYIPEKLDDGKLYVSPNPQNRPLRNA